jgi:sugar lactone lactonase YvrE
MAYTQVQTIAGRGNGPDRFVTALRSLAVDSKDRLYAAGDSEVKVFGRDGTFERRWPTSSPAHAVAVAGDGRVFVGESGQMEIFDEAGRLAHTWRDAQRLGRVTAIGFVGGDVLVADAAGRTIRRFDAGGRFLNDIGRNNRTEGFLIPNGVLDFSVDPSGVIHAANPGKHRVERYTPSDQLLGHIGRFDGIDPSGFPGCCNPTNVTVAGHDRLYVTEKAGPRVKVYDFHGRLLSVIATAPFDFNCKNMDIAVDGRGRVYVADTVRLEIVVFEGGPGQ